MKKSFLVVGLGRLGIAIIEELSKHNNVEIMAIDSNEDAVIKASEIIEHCLICDSTSEAALNQISFDGISQAIITIGGNIQATILTTILLKERGVKKISVRIDDDHYEKIMYKIGADEVIFPERIAGIRYANSIIRDNITDYFNVSDGYGIVQILITDKFKPQTLIELDSRNKYDVNIISIKRNKKVFIPKGSDTINPGDEVLVIGKDAKVAKFNSSINGK